MRSVHRGPCGSRRGIARPLDLSRRRVYPTPRSECRAGTEGSTWSFSHLLLLYSLICFRVGLPRLSAECAHASHVGCLASPLATVDSPRVQRLRTWWKQYGFFSVIPQIVHMNRCLVKMPRLTSLGQLVWSSLLSCLYRNRRGGTCSYNNKKRDIKTICVSQYILVTIIVS